MAQSAAPRDTDWLHYANDLSSTRYSPLTQIDASNFNKLELAWKFSTNALGPRLDADYQSTPLVVKGRIYCTAGFRRDVVCLDAGTGELLWMHTHDEGERIGSRGGPGLGVGYWTDGTNERVVYVTRGYTMFSLDAKTGLLDPNFGTAGKVDLRLDDDQDMDPNKGIIGLHAPPLVVRDTIVVGAAPTLASKGYIRGFDIKTGKRKWIFHTIPKKGEFGYETWTTPGQAETSGNMGSWAPMSADTELGLVYVGVESPQTDLLGVSRTGNHLFAESLVALDIETGVRKWHYQMIHHGIWDRDVSCAGVICDIPHNGKIVKAIAQPTKQGYVYVLDRTTGKPVWPIPEKKVPKGDVPGEWYAPTQPIPSKPAPYARTGVAQSDLIDFTPDLHQKALAVAKNYKIGPIYTPPVLLGSADGPKGLLLVPGTNGGADWGGAAFDPESGMLYVPSAHMPTVIALGKSQHPESTLPYVKQTASWPFGPQGLPDPFKPPYSRLVAIDLNKGDIAWSVANGDGLRNHPAFKGLNLPPLGTPGRLAALVTRSFVFMGEGSDSGVGLPPGGPWGGRKFRAFDKKTGAIAWEMELPAGVSNAPMTYMAKGKQYIVVGISGRQYPGELVALALP